MIFLLYVIAGFLAGVLSGLLGLGGGVIIVPALLILFDWQQFSKGHLMQVATATSLATILITTVMTTWAHNKRGNVQWSLLKILLPGMISGALFGVWLGRYIPGAYLKAIFALFCLALAFRMFFPMNNVNQVDTKPQGLFLLLLCFLAGILSGMLGIGGGVLIIPLLLWLGLPMPQVSATSATCAFPTALTGALSAIVIGWGIVGLPPHTWGFVYWPGALMMGVGSMVGAPLGVHLVSTLPFRLVQQIFGGILLLIAWQIFPK